MTPPRTTQTMKPATAARKLGVYLDATPAEFQEGVVSRAELSALRADPPEWLRDLRRDGPHPRPVVAAKLGVSNAGLARGGVTDALTTEQIDALKKDCPGWLRRERATQAEVRKEAVRLKEKREEEPAEKSAEKSAPRDGRPARSRS
jgi:broad specificity phosphatase PhoE